MSDRIPVPFSSEAVRARNVRKPTPDGWSGAECLLCRRPIRDDRRAVHVHLTTDLELAPIGDVEVENSQGLWPVGPECARRVPREYRIPASRLNSFKDFGGKR